MSDRPSRTAADREPSLAPAAGPTLALELVEVCKYFDGGRVHALDGLSLAVEKGSAVAVTGPSGCGKSTMLHLIAALDVPTAGAIRVGGADLAQIRDLASFRRRRIGFIFQLHNLLPHLNVVQNVEIAMFGTGRTRRQRRLRALSLLADIGMSGFGARRPTELSGGERQRVAIARALANDPELLLADEPTGSLDEHSVEQVLALFAQLRAQRPDMTMLLVTHDPRVAASAERTVRLRHGRVDTQSELPGLRTPNATA